MFCAKRFQANHKKEAKNCINYEGHVPDTSYMREVICTYRKGLLLTEKLIWKWVAQSSFVGNTFGLCHLVYFQSGHIL